MPSPTSCSGSFLASSATSGGAGFVDLEPHQVGDLGPLSPLSREEGDFDKGRGRTNTEAGNRAMADAVL
jgi:hypothetical protein